MQKVFNTLIKSISKIDQVQSIGKTGSEKLIKSTENDVDVFIFCNEIPDFGIRKNLYEGSKKIKLTETQNFKSKHWGNVDILEIDGTEICLMYFSTLKTVKEIDTILAGSRIKKEENYFYPVGRCATIKSINILFDKNLFLQGLKDKLSIYPKTLHDKSMEYHIKNLIDMEDLERAVAMQDVVFYHFALDISMDYFLQLLFNKNYCFFPSRKRNISLMEQMQSKPKNCTNRILEVIKLGGNVNSLNKSYEKWKKLCEELIAN